jgi:L-serine deaminase
VTNYDPENAPDPTAWLALDEQERIHLAEAHHRAARIKLPNVKAHAVFHAIVENQVAERLESVVRAMDRLMNEGLSRHDALHAIGSVVAEHLFEAVEAKTKDDPNSIQIRYNAAVERLSAKEWRSQHDA